ncbi:MAG: hypothetical protein BGO95_01740 [Micrococcales bacterium 73-13]|nr:MAG: hypothetical protein BGO95_01740 [Micrococcales bacterium 73-13]
MVSLDLDAPAPAEQLPPRLFDRDAVHLVRVSKRIHDFERSARFGQPITAPQFAVLLAAARVPGCDQSTIAQLSALGPSTISEVIRRLAQQQKVTVERSPEDARRSRIYVSAGAVEQVERYLADLLRTDSRIVGWLDADGPRMLEILRKLAFREDKVFPMSRMPADGMPEAEAAGLLLAASETNFAFGRLIRIVGTQSTTLWHELEPVDSALVHELLRSVIETPRLSQNLAGRRLYLDRATTAKIVARLEERELITTQASVVDRRRKELAATRTGQALADRLQEVRDRVNRSLLEPLTTGERTALLDGLRRIVVTADLDHD